MSFRLTSRSFSSLKRKCILYSYEKRPSTFCPLRIVRLSLFQGIPSLSISRPFSTQPSPQYHDISKAPPPQWIHRGNLTVERYHEVSDRAMEALLDQLEDLLDSETQSNPDHEVEYSSGVLTLNLGGHGTYVINKQPPNKQIWLSSPQSGPKRYDYSEFDSNWWYWRDEKTLSDLLNEELQAIFGKELGIAL
ncbi:Frataxin [Guyanagaster necrorhizus]|uniref:ferroxidase n=1 Tax=Guyanagaster necrorhizus TaxID=856835 RepID=A0A9P8AWF9_9AGAR|nr:Frataxin [Guyanagaster necrorhizus MCA 3950]KAG7450290.1 Frataxin [Guyanagaster necrorhizus MCA 3950]